MQTRSMTKKRYGYGIFLSLKAKTRKPRAKPKSPKKHLPRVGPDFFSPPYTCTMRCMYQNQPYIVTSSDEEEEQYVSSYAKIKTYGTVRADFTNWTNFK